MDNTTLLNSISYRARALEASKIREVAELGMKQDGVLPLWFGEGDGSILRSSGQVMESPHWADDMGEEPEIAGIYLNGKNGQPFRLGYALANELSDHVMERKNYLFLSHSKLRVCGLGPELLVGDLPSDVQGMSRIYRGGEVLWERPFVSGEDNMTHALSNLEYHHFKYPLFRQPGRVNVHVFGTATLSFVDGITLQDNDIMEIDCPQFGRPLRNPVRTQHIDGPTVFTTVSCARKTEKPKAGGRFSIHKSLSAAPQRNPIVIQSHQLLKVPKV